jgi:Tfp pilus assembly protein PilO
MDFSGLKKSKIVNSLYLLKNEKNRKYFVVGLTISTSVFFLLFAINPTLSTIANLNKQLEDLKLVENSLQTKISSLDSLQSRYQVIESDLNVVSEAIPSQPDSVELTGQIQQAGQSSNVNISSITLAEINYSQQVGNLTQTYPVSIVAEGTYSNISIFLDKLFTMRRIVTFNQISIDKNPQSGNLICNIKAVAYFNK